MKKRIIIIGAVLLAAILIIVGIFLLNNARKSKLSSLEETFVKDAGKTPKLYFDKLDIDDGNGIEEYICFAVYYNFLENNQNKTTVSDVDTIIKKYFSKRIELDKIKENMLSPALFNNNINYDMETETFTLDQPKYSQMDIANITIPVYLYEKATSKKDEFIVTYKKYNINNPYDVLNYFDQRNSEIQRNSSDENLVDTKDILEYLQGKGNVNSIKSKVDSNMIEKVGTYEKSIKVTYVIENDNILIKEFSSIK